MNKIHPTAIIAPEVVLGDENVIGPYSVIVGTCSIGDRNWIGPHVVIGTPGEMRGQHHPAAWDGDASDGPTIIGSGNVFREFVAIQGGFYHETRIGDDCYFMDKVHVAHDEVIGDRVTLSCGVLLAGHVHIGDGANLGLGSVVHQHVAIGAGAMIGMSSVVTRHVLPFAKVYGSPARAHGANTIGLERAGLAAIAAEVEAAQRDSDDIRLERVLPREMAAYRRDVEALAS